MPESTYDLIELVGVSTVSWEEAAKSAIATASKSIQDLRIAEVTGQDVTIENGGIKTYRTRLTASFKYIHF